MIYGNASNSSESPNSSTPVSVLSSNPSDIIRNEKKVSTPSSSSTNSSSSSKSADKNEPFEYSDKKLKPIRECK